MNFDSGNNQQNSSSSDDSPLDFLNQSEVLQSRNEPSILEMEAGEMKEQTIDEASDSIVPPLSESIEEEIEAEQEQKTDELLGNEGNENYVAKPADVAEENLDQIIQQRQEASVQPDRQARIDEIKKGIDEMKSDQMDNNGNKESSGVNKLLLFSGPAFLVVCILVSYLILKDRLFRGGQIFNQLPIEGTGRFTNIHGCNEGDWRDSGDDFEVISDCHEDGNGERCNLDNKSCSAEGDEMVFRFECDGKTSHCDGSGLDGSIAPSKEESGQSMEVGDADCNKTIQIDVFDKDCRDSDNNWICEDEIPIDYITWYTGTCPDDEGDEDEGPDPVCRNVTRINGDSNEIESGEELILRFDINSPDECITSFYRGKDDIANLDYKMNWWVDDNSINYSEDSIISIENEEVSSDCVGDQNTDVSITLKVKGADKDGELKVRFENDEGATSCSYETKVSETPPDNSSISGQAYCYDQTKGVKYLLANADLITYYNSTTGETETLRTNNIGMYESSTASIGDVVAIRIVNPLPQGNTIRDPFEGNPPSNDVYSYSSLVRPIQDSYENYSLTQGVHAGLDFEFSGCETISPETVSISGQVYCSDDGITKYPMPGITIDVQEVAEDFPRTSTTLTTDSNGGFIMTGGQAGHLYDVIPRTSSEEIPDLTLSNGKSYYALYPWTQENSQSSDTYFARNCKNLTATGCQNGKVDDPSNEYMCDVNWPGANYAWCVLDEGSHTNFDFVYTDCEPDVPDTVSISGEVYCQDPGGEKYIMNNVPVNFYNSATGITEEIYTSEYGTYTSSSAQIGDSIRLNINSLGNGGSLSNGKSYYELNFSPQAINCTNDLTTGCDYDLENNPHCADSNKTYAHCVLQNQEHSSFDFVFTGCELDQPDPMVCSTFILNKNSFQYGDTMTINYETTNIAMSDIRIRKLGDDQSEWSIDPFNNLVSYGENSFSLNIHEGTSFIPHNGSEITLSPGTYEIGVVAYDGASNPECTKMCGILADGTLYTTEDDFDGICPSSKYYTPDMGTQQDPECSNNCRAQFTISGPGTYCGDGVIQNPNDQGQNEQCDNGEENGDECDPDYDETCTYCSLECELVELDGGECGDGEVDDGEECDDGNDDNEDGCKNDCTLPECTGDVPDDSEMCEDDDEDIKKDTTRKLVSRCTDERKCEYICKDGYEYQDGECVKKSDPKKPELPVVGSIPPTLIFTIGGIVLVIFGLLF